MEKKEKYNLVVPGISNPDVETRELIVYLEKDERCVSVHVVRGFDGMHQVLYEIFPNGTASGLVSNCLFQHK